MLTADVLELVKSTATSKFETDLQAPIFTDYLKFTAQDTYGTEGYVPMLLGGMGPAQEWLTSRVLHQINEYGVRYVGKVFENSVQIKKEALRVSPVQTAAKLAAKIAANARSFGQKKVVEMLRGNPTGFDNDPLFGDHRYSADSGAPVYNNIIDGSAPSWFLLNDESFIEATAEDYVLQFYGGDNTEIDFVRDSMAFGWRSVKIFAPGFWADSIKSGTALTSDNLHAAMQRQLGFKNDTGEQLASRCKYLVVGPSNYAAAERLMKAQMLSATSNIDYGRYEIIQLDTLEG